MGILIRQRWTGKSKPITGRIWLWLGVGLSVEMAHGQIRTDGTVGTALSLTGPAFDIPSSLGRQVGPNLFHSFQTFNLAAGQAATFTGPANIANVLSRVTGGTTSTIDGALRCTIPQANFFFVNPAGVVFGPKASVEVGGALAVSSADYVRLADGGRFDARAPANDVLTVAPPAAFGFLPPATGRSIAGISIRGSSLETAAGADLTFVGGSIQASDAALVRAPGARLALVAVDSAGEVPTGDLQVSAFRALGDVELRDDSFFSSSHDAGGGRFLVRARNLSLLGTGDGTGLANNTRASGVGGNSEVALTGALKLNGGSFLSSSGTVAGSGGNLAIVADRIELKDAYIDLWTGSPIHRGDGRGGSLSIQAREMAMFGSEISANTTGTGPGGNIELTVGSLLLRDASSIGSASTGAANAGNIRVKAETVDLTGNLFFGLFPAPCQIASDASAAGRAGNVEIEARDIGLHVAATIASRTFGTGSAGAIVVRAENSLRLDGRSSIAASTDGQVLGADAGSIDIRAREISLVGDGVDESGNANISTSAYRFGQAGPIQLTADQLTVRDGASVTSSGSGQASGGEIRINARTLELKNGYIDSSAFDQGKGGNIMIAADRTLMDGDFAVVSSRVRTGTGRAGNIELRGGQLRLTNEAAVSSTTFAQGAGGTIHIAVDYLEVNSAEISSKSLAIGSGGDAGEVVVAADEVRVVNFGAISTSTRNTGKGGRIALQANTVVLDDFGSITAGTTGSGAGGWIDIQTDSLFVNLSSRISTESTSTGPAGVIAVTAAAGGIEVNRFSRISSSATAGVAGGVTLRSAGRIDVLGESRILVKSERNDAGTIALLAPDYLLVRNSLVSAEAYRNGGNISIDPTIFGLENGVLNANAVIGDGGHIEIVADFVYQLWDSRITAISENSSAQQGTVSIRSGMDLAGSLVGLPGGLVSARSEVREGCERRNPQANSLMFRGRGGLAPRPDSFLMSHDTRP